MGSVRWAGETEDVYIRRGEGCKGQYGASKGRLTLVRGVSVPLTPLRPALLLGLPSRFDTFEDLTGLLDIPRRPEPNRYPSHSLQRRGLNGFRCYMPLKCYEMYV
jgi:hypothetical protein